MIADERRALLIRKLREDGYIQVTEIAQELDISSATIRRDLTQLEEEGYCMRTRGGAVRTSQSTTLELPYDIKRQKNVPEKNRIAHEALKFIENGDTIILDAGSTTYALAQLLKTRQRLTVVTNDLQISISLASNPNINLICTGGIARPYVFTLQGNEVVSFIEQLKVDKVFLGADAIHDDGTIGNVNIEEVAIKQAMLAAASKVILLADSSKFTLKGFAKVCDLKDVDVVVTDSGSSDVHQKMIREAGTELVVAP